MNMLAPEFSALMIILRSTGPVISVRRSVRSAGIGATVHARVADMRRFRQKIRTLAGIDAILPLRAFRQQFQSPRH